MTRNKLAAIFLSALAAFAQIGPALASDNAITLTTGTGVTLRSKDIGSGVQSLIQILGDTSGNPLATAPGTGNTSFALPVQGVSGGVAMPISAASLPLPTSAATNAELITINTTLGSPFQAGASIGNSAFGITGNSNTAYVTTGHALQGDVTSMGGTAINSGCVSNYGTAPSAVACPSVNAYVTGAVGLPQGSTTSGQTGSMIMGAATTSAPSYTTAQTNPLSLDLNGGLRLAPSCVGNTIPINQTGSTDVHTFTGYGYICSIVLVTGTQQSISLSEGTGSTCGSGTVYLLGGSGGTMVLAQYGGFSAVSGNPYMKLKNSADHLCVLQSSTGNVSGFITFADLTN